MKSRVFKMKIERCHLLHLSNLLDIPYLNHSGIDLADDYIGIELKSRYRVYSNNFAVHHYQIRQFRNDNKSKELFWAFLLYDLMQKPSTIRRENIESLVLRREIWFFDWDFIRKFPVSRPKTGPYVYVNARHFDDKDHSLLTRQGSTLYIPKDSALEKRLI